MLSATVSLSRILIAPSVPPAVSVSVSVAVAVAVTLVVLMAVSISAVAVVSVTSKRASIRLAAAIIYPVIPRRNRRGCLGCVRSHRRLRESGAAR
jgi:hypothetical protein